MALPKRVKSGGSFYEGYKLDVATASGDYPIAIIPSNTSFAVNGVSITPSSTGDGDYFSLLHVNTTATVGGGTVAILATNVYNIGGGVSIMLDFASLELVKPGESLRFVYHNTASQPMMVYVTVESIK